MHFPSWRVGAIVIDANLRQASDAPAIWFYLATAGEVRISLEAENSSVALRRGDAAIIVCRSQHDSIGLYRMGDAAEKSKVLFGGFATEMAGARQMELLLPPMAVFAASEQPGPLGCEEFVNWLSAEANSDRSGAAAVVSRFLQSLFVETLRTYLATAAEQASSPIAKSTGPLQAALDPCLGSVLRMVHATPERDWTVHSLARESGLSRSAFADRFRTLVGQPPLQYVTEIRMQKATELLETTDIPVKRIAALVGYESVSAFSSAFKRRFGGPPVSIRSKTTGVTPLGRK